MISSTETKYFLKKPKIGWKVLLKGMKSQHGDLKWKKGVWNKVDGELKLCYKGLHASKLLPDAMDYITPGIITKVEYRGDVVEGDDKFVASEMRVLKTYRFTKKMAVEYAVWCARRCLKNFEKKNPNDKRLREAILAAEKVLKKDTKKNRDEAKSAARSAESAWSAAESVARSAESAWSAAWSARSAWSAAESVARSAESAWSAARSAESAWSAAWSARSAARSAESAARSAESAAESAAWSAEKKAQHNKLMKFIGEK